MGKHARQGDEASSPRSVEHAPCPRQGASCGSLSPTLLTLLSLLTFSDTGVRAGSASSAADPRGWRVRLCYLHILSLAPRQRLQIRDTDPLESVYGNNSRADTHTRTQTHTHTHTHTRSPCTAFYTSSLATEFHRVSLFFFLTKRKTHTIPRHTGFLGGLQYNLRSQGPCM